MGQMYSYFLENAFIFMSNFFVTMRKPESLERTVASDLVGEEVVDQLDDVCPSDLVLHRLAVFLLLLLVQLCGAQLDELVQDVDLAVHAVVCRVHALVRPRAALPCDLLEVA